MFHRGVSKNNRLSKLVSNVPNQYPKLNPINKTNFNQNMNNKLQSRKDKQT